MGETYIVNGQVYIGRRFEEKALCLRDGKLQVLGKNASVPKGARMIDVCGKRVVPGFIDVHTHGAVGVDVNGASTEDLEKISRFFAGNGTTSWLCSVLTDTVEQTEWCIDQFKAHKAGEQPTSELLGIHLEGPFLASEYKGAMPERLLRKGDPELLRRYQERAEGNIRYITVSPEVEGVVDMIPTARELGIATAIGLMLMNIGLRDVHGGDPAGSPGRDPHLQRHGPAPPAPARHYGRGAGVGRLL